MLRVLVTMWRASFIMWTFLCPLCFAYNRTTEAGEAAIDDGSVECQPYSYPLVTNNLSLFPPIWKPASILQNDVVALNLWNSISGNIPNISVKGTINGGFSSVLQSYPSSDPDCWWTYDGCMTPKHQGLLPDVYQVPEPRTLGYGFDDGPNCSHNAFYDFLSNNNQKATMFYIGSNVMSWPLEAQRAPADGHEVCAHSWSHRYMTAFTSEDAFAELYYNASDQVSNWHNPDMLEDDRIRAIAHSLGLQTIMWGYDSNDWRVEEGQVTPAAVDANYQRLINNAISGHFNTTGPIMLTHELDNFTMSEAIKFYPQLKAAFDHIEPVGVALDLTSGNVLPTGTPTTTSPTSSSPAFHNAGATSLRQPPPMILLSALLGILIF